MKSLKILLKQSNPNTDFIIEKCRIEQTGKKSATVFWKAPENKPDSYLVSLHNEKTSKDIFVESSDKEDFIQHEMITDLEVFSLVT